nr:MAG TPA: hypothetical protein [Caudoviricetes sp.]
MRRNEVLTHNTLPQICPKSFLKLSLVNGR